MKTIDTVIFDLSEVLLSGLLGSKEEIAKYLEIPSRTLKLVTSDLSQLFLGHISEEEYLYSLIRENQLKRNKTTDVLKTIIRDGFTEIDGTRPIIAELRKKNFKLGLLSVHAREWIDFCENKFRYQSLFDQVLYSFEIGVCKPEQESYIAILKRLDSSPNRTLFIDDSLENIQGASSVGVHSLQFQSVQQIGSDLQVFDIYI